MHTCTRVLAVILTFAALRTSWAEDWPTFRSDNRRNGKSADKLDTSRLRTLWKWRSPQPPQPAWSGPAKWDAYAGIRGLKSMRNYDPVFHPIITKGHVYFGSSVEDSVYCLSAETGKVVWRFTTDGPVRVAPTYWKGKLFFGSDDGYVYCLNAEDAKLIWRFNPAQHHFAQSKQPLPERIVNNGRLVSFWPCRSGVAIENGIAYFTASLLPWKKSFLVGIDANSGSLDKKDCFFKAFDNQTMEGPLLTSPERIIVPQGRVAPKLFDRLSGAAQGSLQGGGGSFVVLTADDRVLHGPGNKLGWITSSKSATRERIATFQRGNAMIVDGAISYLLTDDAIVASDFVKRKVLWKTDSAYPLTMIMAGNSLVVGGRDGVAAYSHKSGEQLWSASTNGSVYGMAAADGRLVVSTDEGVVHAFSSSGQPIQRTATKQALPAASPGQAVLKARRRTKKDPHLLGHWRFTPEYTSPKRAFDLSGRRDAQLVKAGRFVAVSNGQAMELDSSQRIVIAPDYKQVKVPTQNITVSARVRIDKPNKWGGLVGVIQDNGSYERGWLLGSRDSHFSFAVKAKDGAASLTYLTAPKAFQPGTWYHVTGTYDGKTIRLFVDGKQVASSTAQSGPIDYPPAAFYEIGRYHDKDEDYGTVGQLHEVKIHDTVLADEQIQREAAQSPIKSLRPIQLAFGPTLRFTAPDRATISWETPEATACQLTLRNNGKIEQTISLPAAKHHRAKIDKLRRNTQYEFTLSLSREGHAQTTRAFECDTFFNYAKTAAARLSTAVESAQDANAEELVRLFQHSGGLGVIVGNPKPAFVLTLLRNTGMRWVVVCDQQDVERSLRKALFAAHVYGSHVSVHHVEKLANIPFTKCFANCVIAMEQINDDGMRNEIERITRPDGGIALAQFPANLKTEKWAPIKAGDATWMRFTRPALPGAGQWSHLYGAADNTAFGGETLQKASRTSDLEVQWIGRPGARYQPDRNGRKPSPLSTAGQLYLQGLRRLVALDAFNGTVLWSWELPELGRFNMPRDCSNWCADRKHVFVTIRSRCLQLDGRTGDIVAQHYVPASSEHDWSFVARVGDLLIGSQVREGAAFDSFWGKANDGWYDAKSGAATAKVCSERLFAKQVNPSPNGPGAKAFAWQYAGGLIINSTITIANGRIFFVENRNESLKAKTERRIASPELWQDRYMVALDLKTGKRVWEKPIDTPAGTVVYYMASAKQKLALIASSNKQYHINLFDGRDGKAIWKKSFAWQSDNHGGHMSRPAIVGDTIYVRPRAFELATGTQLSVRMPGGGCGTYAATSDALFFRSGNVTVWDRQRGQTTKWNRLRPDCWLSTIPASGMLLSPEGGGGCSCGSWLETSLGFIPKSPAAR